MSLSDLLKRLQTLTKKIKILNTHTNFLSYKYTKF